MEKKGWSCNICRKEFVNKSNLIRHIRSIHKVNIKKNQKKILCGVCKISFNFYKSLEEHLCEKHNFTPKVERKLFPSIEGFQAYKKNLEESQASFFATARRVGSKTYYACHLSGSSKSLKQEKDPNYQKSGKINATCPARIEVDIKGDLVESFTQLQHFGHSCSIKFLRLRKEDRAAIAAQIDKGISFDRILNDLRSSTNKNFLKRINLIKKKDLHNIAREFNIYKGDRYLSDSVRLDMWVSKQNFEKNNPILFYKKQGEASDRLEEEDFMLVFSTLYLKTTPNKSVTKILCDSTLGNNNNNFQLTTLLTINEHETGLPLAYCISNKIDTKTMVAFFQVIKENQGEYNAVFMAHDAQASYDAWCQVMNIPNQRLICSWLVLKCWKAKLKAECSNWGEERKQKILTFCRELLGTSKTNEFFSLLNEFLNYCSGHEETKHFSEYFVKTYASRPENWAYSFWAEKNFNTNLYLKSLHRTFKYCYSEGKKCRRVDKCINLLMTFTEVMHKWTAPEIKSKQMQQILESHRQSLKIPISFIKKVKNNKWILKGQSTDRPKIVQVVEEVCKCILKCPHCQVCVHQVSCTCLNFLVCGNICKHVHACLNVPYPWKLTSKKVSPHAQESVLIDESIEFLEGVGEKPFHTKSLQSRKKDIIKDLQLICDLIDVVPEKVLNELHKFTLEFLPKVVEFAAHQLEHQEMEEKQAKNILFENNAKVKAAAGKTSLIIVTESVDDQEGVEDANETQLCVHTEFDHKY